MSVTLRTWFREPLLHFLAAGAAIFLLYRLVGGGEEGPREIVVSEAQIESLADGFARTWMRPPTAAEIRGLVDDYIREEVYYREAMTLGLDRDDTVIRRRLRQKMEFVSDDVPDTAVALAGGTSQDANTRRVPVFRQIGGKRQAAAFDLTSIRRGEMEDPRVYAGDIVVVDGSSVKAATKPILNSMPLLSIFRPF